jgi:hypothetical protein
MQRLGQRAGGRERGLREDMWQIEFAHRDLDLDPGIGLVAEHLDDATDRLRMCGWLCDQLDRDDLSGTRAWTALDRGHEHILCNAPIGGNEKKHAVLGVQAPDDAPRRARKDFDDRAAGSTACVAPSNAHRGTVTVQRLAHFDARQRDRGRARRVGHEKAESVGMTLDASGDQRDTARDEHAARTVAQQRATRQQGLQRDLKRRAIALGDAEPGTELFGREWRTFALERLEYGLRQISLARRTLRARTPAQRRAFRGSPCVARRLLHMRLCATPQRGAFL